MIYQNSYIINLKLIVDKMKIYDNYMFHFRVEDRDLHIDMLHQYYHKKPLVWWAIACLVHVISIVAMQIMTRYSTLVEERAMELCFFKLNEIGLWIRNTMRILFNTKYPLVID